MSKEIHIKNIEDALKNNQNDYNGKFIGEELLKVLKIARNEKKYNELTDTSIIENLFRDESILGTSSIDYLKSIYNKAIHDFQWSFYCHG